MVWRRHGGKTIEPSVQVSINTKRSDAQTMTFDNSQRMRTQEDVIGSLLRGEYALALYYRGSPAWHPWWDVSVAC
eukprot:2181216-Prymnesium_polylepis.1